MPEEKSCSMRYRLNILKSILRHPLQTIQIIKDMLVPRATERWENVDSLYAEWDPRTIKIAELIPTGAKVLEFGAGRFVLRDHLAPGCTYQPSDIVDRGEGVIVCDLNKGFPALNEHYSHVVFSGVLEYIEDIGGLLDELKNQCDVIICSYSTIDEIADFITRKKNGWVNHLTNGELVALFRNRNWQLVHTDSWKYQVIYVFEIIK